MQNWTDKSRHKGVPEATSLLESVLYSELVKFEFEPEKSRIDRLQVTHKRNKPRCTLTCCVLTMHCLCLLFGHFIVPLILMFNTQADYIIDDSNSTISYLGPRAQIPVVNTMQINSSELYDNTV